MPAKRKHVVTHVTHHDDESESLDRMLADLFGPEGPVGIDREDVNELP